MDVRKLASLNGMQPGDSVYAGQHIVLKRFASTVEPAPTAPAAHSSQIHTAPAYRSAARSSARAVSYTVRPGDTLSRIARMFQVNIHQIMTWNGMATQAALKAGQRLTINVHSNKDPS
jgi:membrane-bound lytic murein transglycosylase D